MEPKPQGHRRPVDRWVWLAFFAGLVLWQAYAWLDTRAPHLLLSGAGLLMLGAHAYRDPVVMRAPLWTQLRTPRRTADGRVDLLGLVGLLLALAGALWRWSTA